MSGSLEVITGPMFSGKSEELIRRVRRWEIAKKRVLVCKPVMDTRNVNISSRNGLSTEAVELSEGMLLRPYADTQDAEVIALDEAQFFKEDIVPQVIALMREHRRVIVAGLDLDFEEQPFPVMAHLLALATDIAKLTAVCECGKDAVRSKRLVPSLQKIVVGDTEAYKPQCLACFYKK